MKFFLISLLCIILYSQYVYSDPCPKKCSCHSSWIRGVTSVVVDCSKRSLTTIPTKRVSRYITSFVLNENLITKLPKDAFRKYRYLRELYLYKNFLTHIHKDAFKGLSRLTDLSLHSNKLTEIENGTFRHLRRLKKLSSADFTANDCNNVKLRFVYLFTNEIRSINLESFTGLRKVETIFLHDNLLREIPKDTFVSLHQLRVLTLYRNHLQTLHTGAFNGLLSVTQLYLHQNKISDIQPHVFRDCKSLIKLQIGSNRLNEIKSSSLLGLHRLLELYLDNNRIRSIQVGTFAPVKGLRKLVLLGNRIEDLRIGSFSNLTELAVLSLSGNKIRRLGPGVFTGLESIQQLFLQENKIEWLAPYTFQGLRTLQQLYLFRNRINFIEENTFYGMFSLSELNLGVNNISGIANGAFVGLPRLLVLQLNSNRISVIRKNTFQKLRNLYRLVIFFNSIRYIAEGAFDETRRLVSIVWYPPVTLVQTSKVLQKIKSNNLYCDCHSKWLQDWLKRTKLRTAIYCEYPKFLKGWNVTEVEERYIQRCDPLTINVTPQDVISAPQTDVHLQCTVNTIANYTWVKDGKDLHASWTAFQKTTGHLIIRNASVNDSGQYTCVAKGVYGNTIAASTKVKVGASPVIVGDTEESILIYDLDQTIVISCVGRGIPAPLHVWYFNGKPIVDGAANKFIGYDGRLIITKLSENDMGIYKCEISNELGLDQKYISVRSGNEFLSLCHSTCSDGYICKKSYSCQCERTLCTSSSKNKETALDVGSGDAGDNEPGEDDSDDGYHT